MLFRASLSETFPASYVHVRVTLSLIYGNSEVPQQKASGPGSPNEQPYLILERKSFLSQTIVPNLWFVFG